MWMAYKGEVAIYNLRSAVEATYDRFRDLAFDADHEAVYGMNYFPAEWCIERAKRYRQAAGVCSEYLDYKLCKLCLVRRLDEMDFVSDTDDIKKFLHQADDESVKCSLCQ